MGKRINILTFHKALNYGAVMQAYALSQVCRNLGFEVKMVNLEWSDFLLLRIKKAWHFWRFRTKYLPPNTTGVIKHLKDFDSNKDLIADYWIVGSDQVWNLDITGEMYPAFFFHFVTQGEKISYAASLGVDIWKWDTQYTNEIKNYLTHFKAISVRESSGIDLCKCHLGISAENVLDPTLLLNDYSEIIGKSKGIKEEVVSYKFLKSSRYYSVIDEIRKELGLNRVKELSSIKPRLSKNTYFPIQISVSSWLKSIRDAKFVVTDSFHGVCFCIIFEKEFIYIPGAQERANRIIDLLTLLGLDHRVFKSIEQVLESNTWKEPISYERVREKLQLARNHSLNFLKTNLNV